MPIFLFFSQRDTTVFGLTSEFDGENLPTELAPWSSFGNGEALYTASPDTLAERKPGDPVIATIAFNGFYLGRTSSPFIKH